MRRGLQTGDTTNGSSLKAATVMNNDTMMIIVTDVTTDVITETHLTGAGTTHGRAAGTTIEVATARAAADPTDTDADLYIAYLTIRIK